MIAPSPASFSEAVTLHQRGELELAARIYRDILEAEPNHADALHLLGVLFIQGGQPHQAIPLIERAIAANPSAAVFHGNLAEAYRACGQLQRAAASYQVALRLQPALVDVAINFGSLLMQVGKAPEAAALFRHALQHNPRSALAHNNLANAFRLQGNSEQAMTHFRRAVEIDPSLGLAHGNLGQLLLEHRQPQEALHHCQEAVRLQPQAAPARNNLGNVLRALGRMEEAKACYTEALRLAPDLAMIHNNIGQIVQEEGKLDEAVRWLRQAVQLEPNTLRFHVNLANALTEQLDFETAEGHLRTVLQAEPRHAEARFARGKLRFEQGRLEEAVMDYRAALEVQPNNPLVNHCLGEVLLELNRTDEAIASFRTALRGNPRHALSLARLADCLRDKLPEEEREALRRLSVDPQLPEADRAPLLFALAQLCDLSGAYEEAAQHLERANALELTQRQTHGQGYNVQAHVGFVDRLLTVFTPEWFARIDGFGVDSERPVFIVGLPRSGTTLLEQVLASHSRVFGAGELRLAREGFEALGRGSDGMSEARAFDALQTIDAETVRNLARNHLARLNGLNATAARVIDKMPDNYMYLGFLAMLFPQARFLNCRRDPRDVAVSCWSTQFRSIPWANHPDHLVSRFTQYQRVMDHWRRVLPMPVLDVDYEDLVGDLEGTARRILAFCGLEWEAACLDFHRSPRPVRTASVTQVRQPIYRSSLARWRHYEKSLQPLFAQLGGSADEVASNHPEEQPLTVGAN